MVESICTLFLPPFFLPPLFIPSYLASQSKKLLAVEAVEALLVARADLEAVEALLVEVLSMRHTLALDQPVPCRSTPS